MSRIPHRSGAVLTTAVLLALFVTAPNAAAAPGATAYLRAAHFSPDTPGVDVYLTSFGGGTTKLWLSDVSYGAVSPYHRISAGVYAVSMRPHGAPKSSPPVLRWTLHARSGAAYTAAGVGLNKHLHAVVLHDQLNAPAAGKARVRVINAASRTPSVDVRTVDGPPVTAGARFGTTTGYTTVPAGRSTLRISGKHSDVSTTTTASLKSGSIESVVVLDKKHGSGIGAETVTDAAGAPTMPSGAVPAGGGGTAPLPSDHAPLAPLLSAALLTVLAAGGIVIRRQRRS